MKLNKNKYGPNLELLTELEKETLKNLTYLLNSLDLGSSVLVNYYALRLQGYDVEPWDKNSEIDVVVDRDNLPWKTKGEKIREVIPPRDSGYFKQWQEFILKYQSNFPLHFIPEPHDKVIKLDYSEHKFSSWQILRICKPITNVLGFKEALDAYCKKVDEYKQRIFDEKEIERWERKIRNVKSAAERKEDRDLINACKECNDQLRVLYRKIKKQQLYKHCLFL